MENKLVDKVTRSFEVELPYRETLDEYLDVVLREVRQWGEDLTEKKFYVAQGGKPWMEIRDEENFHEAILHFFNDNGEYLQSVNGNLSRGKWRLMDGNKLILEANNRSELYVLAFLSTTFFILRKHGNHRKSRGRYFVMGYEPYMIGLEWRDYVELLFNTYRDNQTSFRTIVIILIVAAAAIIFFSLL